MNKEAKSRHRARKYVEKKHNKSFSDQEFDQLFQLGKKIKGTGGPILSKDYSEKEQLAISIHNMYELTIEFYDEIPEKEFYEFDTSITNE